MINQTSTKEQTMTETSSEATIADQLAAAVERQNLEPTRASIEEFRLKRQQAISNVEAADIEIAEREKHLRNLKRWRNHQADRIAIFDRRVKLDIDLIRSIEDYEASAE